MLTLLGEGGFPIWFLLVFGASTLIFATRYASAPTGVWLRVTLCLGAATLLTIMTCVSASLAQVGHHAAEYHQVHPELTLADVLLQGFAESMSSAILGFTILSLAALILTLGAYRGQTS